MDAGLRLARRQDDLDAGRCAAVGASFGGYWAMKLAYTHRERLALRRQLGRRRPHHLHARVAAAVARTRSSYLMDLMPARARIFGGETFEDYVARCPALSLLDQGLLDQPSAPLLLVNGRDDVQNSIDDIYLSLDHGDPKSARVFDGGHMGEGPVVPTIVAWVRRLATLSRDRAAARRHGPRCRRAAPSSSRTGRRRARTRSRARHSTSSGTRPRRRRRSRGGGAARADRPSARDAAAIRTGRSSASSTSSLARARRCTARSRSTTGSCSRAR